MINDIKLWEGNPPDSELISGDGDMNNKGLPTLTPYFLKGDGPYPAIIVCPGGGLKFRAAHEGEPVAKWLNGFGITAFVLNYRVAPYT